MTQPAIESQIITFDQSGPFRRSGVKYSQWNTAPMYPSRRPHRVAFKTASPLVADT